MKLIDEDAAAASAPVNGQQQPLLVPNKMRCENNNQVNGLEGVRLRSTGSKILPNGRLSPRRELSPARTSLGSSSRDVSPLRDQDSDTMPRAVYDKLKTLTSVAQAAEDQIRELQATLKDTLREGRPPLLPASATSWSPDKKKSTATTTSSPGGRPSMRDKEFVVRNSPLTDLFAISHIATIYHVAVVVLIVLVLKTLVHDLVVHNTVNLSVDLIWWSFGGFHRVITIWLVMMLAVMVQYATFIAWAQRRLQLPPGLLRWAWDGAFLLALVLFDVALFTLPVLRVVHYDMPIASSGAVLTESVRLLMKSHAFVRSNAPRALQDGSSPGFSQFLYFMFAPTLIYRDSYPRTAQIRWRVVVCHMLEVVGCIFYVSFLAERYLLPLFEDFGRKPLTPLDGLSILLSAVLPAGLSFMCLFYLLLHSWQNAWAEMLRFGDRMFYMDWWNQTSFSSYYRTWNVLVQDWLYSYVYKDVLLLGGNSLMAKLAVFGISAVVHEFILGFTMRFFYPVLYVFFGVIGMLLSFANYQAPMSSSAGNIFLWLSLFLGDGILFGLYSIEYNARQNCAQVIDSSWDLFIPRSWSCEPVAVVAT